jgi:hypothetical protein
MGPEPVSRFTSNTLQLRGALDANVAREAVIGWVLSGTTTCQTQKGMCVALPSLAAATAKTTERRPPFISNHI